MILLTDKEIPYEPDGENSEYWGDIGARDKGIYIEGAKAQLKKVADRIKFSHRGTDGWVFLYVQEDEWLSLLKELKRENKNRPT
jgi:hypothetical protein